MSSAANAKSTVAAKKSLQKFLKSLDTVPTKVLEDEAPKLYAQIIAETPYESGKLEKSVRVSVSKNKRDRVGLLASASAKSPKGYDYSAKQHEDTSLQHPRKGKAHYISDPFYRAVRRIKSKMRKELKPNG